VRFRGEIIEVGPSSLSSDGYNYNDNIEYLSNGVHGEYRHTVAVESASSQAKVTNDMPHTNSTLTSLKAMSLVIYASIGSLSGSVIVVHLDRDERSAMMVWYWTP